MKYIKSRKVKKKMSYESQSQCLKEKWSKSAGNSLGHQSINNLQWPWSEYFQWLCRRKAGLQCTE